MYFYKAKGKQVLDLRGDMVVSHNDALVKARCKSAGPSKVCNAKFVLLGKGKFVGRVIATYHVLRYIWGRRQPLKVPTR